MDLVFKRYHNPYSFLDEFISHNELDECVTYLIGKDRDEKDWELYLSLNPLNEKSFSDWKNELYGLLNDSSEINNISKSEAEEIFKTTSEQAQNILKNFEPPKNG